MNEETARCASCGHAREYHEGEACMVAWEFFTDAKGFTTGLTCHCKGFVVDPPRLVRARELLQELVRVAETAHDRDEWLPALRAAVRVGTEVAGADRRWWL